MGYADKLGMRLGIRLRFALWLVAALVPVGIATSYILSEVESDLVERVSVDLASVRDLEQSRIESALDLYRERARGLADGPHVREFTSQVVGARHAGTQISGIAGYDGFAPVDAFEDQPLQELANALQRKATASEIAALQMLGPDGELLGETRGFDWEPVDPSIFKRAAVSRRTLVGDAFRDSDGADRLGLVTPILSMDNRVVGMLVLETELGPIVDLVEAHEGFGETSEAHIAQATADGDAEFITLLRFDRSAAFRRVVPADKGLPINQSLTTPGGQVVLSPDYRGEESILAIETLESTGWGLVVKVDRAEALSPILTNLNRLKAVAILGALGILFGWAAFLDPVARRLRGMAAGAERLASGDYGTPLYDRRSDEIGWVAKSIDRLATDLATDIAVRSDIEARLRHQATHDTTTGLFNRQYATSFMTDLAAPAASTVGDSTVADDAMADDDMAAPFSLLFIDLDNFKSINDSYGHATGDEVLAATAARLEQVIEGRGCAARWGGDEFVLVMPETSEGGAQDMMRAVERRFVEPIGTQAGVHLVRPSIGVSTHHRGDSIEKLIHSADEAMFNSKQRHSGRGGSSIESLRLVKQALEADDVDVWFQPRVKVADKGPAQLTGAEAFVRITDRNGDIVAPGSFLRDVEKSTVGRLLDRRIMWRSLEALAGWIRSGQLPTDFQMSVNCCEALLRHDDTPQFVATALDHFGLEPHNLMLEINEQVVALQADVLKTLHAMGVVIALDDFGSSHSNVDRLTADGVSVAKINQRWVQRDSSDPATGLTVLGHLVGLCASLDLEVVADGVESPGEYAQVRGLGIAAFQGHLFAPAMSADEFVEKFLV